jgi:hypothetical protein
VVRSESKELAAFACEVLDRLSIGMQPGTQAKMETDTATSP